MNKSVYVMWVCSVCMADLSLLYSPCQKYFAPVELLIFSSFASAVVENDFCLPFAYSCTVGQPHHAIICQISALCLPIWNDKTSTHTCAALNWAYIVLCGIECDVLWCDVTMLCISIWCPYAPTVAQHTTHANCMGNIKLLMEDESIAVKWFLLLTQ